VWNEIGRVREFSVKGTDHSKGRRAVANDMLLATSDNVQMYSRTGAHRRCASVRGSARFRAFFTKKSFHIGANVVYFSKWRPISTSFTELFYSQFMCARPKFHSFTLGYLRWILKSDSQRERRLEFLANCILLSPDAQPPFPRFTFPTSAARFKCSIGNAIRPE